MNNIKFLVSIFLLLFSTLSLNKRLYAQFFGFSLDSAVSYSSAEKAVVGGSFGVNHPIPFIPNLGYSRLNFEESEKQ